MPAPPTLRVTAAGREFLHELAESRWPASCAVLAAAPENKKAAFNRAAAHRLVARAGTRVTMTHLGFSVESLLLLHAGLPQRTRASSAWDVHAGETAFVAGYLARVK